MCVLERAHATGGAVRPLLDARGVSLVGPRHRMPSLEELSLESFAAAGPAVAAGVLTVLDLALSDSKVLTEWCLLTRVSSPLDDLESSNARAR